MGFLLLKRSSLPIYKTSDLKKWIAKEPYYTVMVRYMRVYLFLNVLQKIKYIFIKNVSCPLGQLDQAATWLLENVENMVGHGQSSGSLTSSSLATSLSGVEVKAESICICFIDDCLDCDIPLAELTFSSKACKQQLSTLHWFLTATQFLINHF